MSTHYSKALSPAKLSAWADKAALALTSALRPEEIPVLVYRGLSGTASATALSLALDAHGIKLGMVYVRKSGEMGDCHGQRVETSFPEKAQGERFVAVFVDDFISSGNTRQKVFERAAPEFSFIDVLNVTSGNGPTGTGHVWRCTFDEVTANESRSGYDVPNAIPLAA